MEQVFEKMQAKESIYVVYMVDKQKITVVSYSDFEKWDFIPAATFYIKDAMGNYIFVHTASRSVAQEWVDIEYGKGRYSVNASRLQKGKPLGEHSKPAFGTATRKGQKR
jgi:hypothetical protein